MDIAAFLTPSALTALLEIRRRAQWPQMGLAANVIAKYIERFRWVAWVGLAVIVWVAGKMIREGWHEVAP